MTDDIEAKRAAMEDDLFVALAASGLFGETDDGPIRELADDLAQAIMRNLPRPLVINVPPAEIRELRVIPEKRDRKVVFKTNLEGQEQATITDA